MDRPQAVLELKELDKDILRTLYRFGFLETEQVGRLFCTEEPEPANAVAGRLRLLKLRGFAGSLREHNQMKTPAVSRTFWFLDSFGLRVVEEMEGIPRANRVKKSESILQILFLEHIRLTNEIYIELELLRRRRYLDLLVWRGTREGRLEFPGFTGGGRSVLTPDATVTLGREGRLASWFLEVDRATMSLTRIREKMGRYREMYVELARPERLLFLTVGEARRDDVQKLMAEHGLRGRSVLFRDAVGHLVGGEGGEG